MPNPAAVATVPGPYCTQQKQEPTTCDERIKKVPLEKIPAQESRAEQEYDLLGWRGTEDGSWRKPGRIEVNEELPFANVSKLGMRLDMI